MPSKSIAPPIPIESDITTWPADLIYLFHERSAIREMDGKQSRKTAEAAAKAEAWQHWLTTAFDPMSQVEF